MNPMWKVYKSKVMKTLNPEYEDEMTEEVSEVENDISPIQEEEGPNAVSQLARKMQGAGTKSWNRLSSMFNKEDEHQLLEETESPPVADHPLAVKPEEPPPRPSRRSGFWDSFASNWAAKKQAEAAAAAAADEGAAGAQAEGGGAEVSVEERQDGQAEATQGAERSSNSFSKYVTLGGGGGGEGNEEASFKWNFVTSKLAELKTKSMTKTN